MAPRHSAIATLRISCTARAQLCVPSSSRQARSTFTSTTKKVSAMLERLDRLIGFRWLYTRYRQFVTGGVFLKTQEVPVDEIERYKRGANAVQVGGKHYKQLP